MYDTLKELIKPELILLIPVLYFVGKALKKSAIADKHIPWILGTVAVFLSFLFVLATTQISNWQEVIMMIFVSFTQGVLCAGASVYINQIIKQNKK